MADRSDLAAPTGRRRLTVHALPLRAAEASVLSAVRIVISFMYVCHAAQKMFGWFGGLAGQGAAVPVGAWPGWWAGLIELVGGALILLGLLTRPAAVLCSGEMAFAYFTVHQRLAPLPLQNHGELAALFCWIFLLIAALGAGPVSLDALLGRQRHGDTDAGARRYPPPGAGRGAWGRPGPQKARNAGAENCTLSSIARRARGSYVLSARRRQD